MGQHFSMRNTHGAPRVYHGEREGRAAGRWDIALKRVCRSRDRFASLAYLVSMHCDSGNIREMLACSVKQLNIAEEMDDEGMRAEAYLSLARTNQRLCEYHKAVSYCRCSLQHQARRPQVHGYAFLCLGQAYHGFSNFSKALESFEQARTIARKCEDDTLYLHVYNELGNVYVTLKDDVTALSFHERAEALCTSFKVMDLNNKYHRTTFVNMVTPLRKTGKRKEALSHCEVGSNQGFF